MTIPIAIQIRIESKDDDSISVLLDPVSIKLQTPLIQTTTFDESPYTKYSLAPWPEESCKMMTSCPQEQRGYNISPIRNLKQIQDCTEKNDLNNHHRLQKWKKERTEWEKSTKKRRLRMIPSHDFSK